MSERYITPDSAATILQKISGQIEESRDMVLQVQHVTGGYYKSGILRRSKAYQEVIHDVDFEIRHGEILGLVGESGTGKDTFAQAIHNESPRKDAVFLRFNCASVPTEFIDTELFGFADGLGHGNRHGGAPGKIELANGGTLYLDEIGQLSPEQQRHLLHVLENSSVVRLGETEERPVDVRMITSSSEDLAGMVVAGRFRADLYYRLNVFLLELPKLSEHISDIPVLAAHFCEDIADRFGKPGVEISQEAMESQSARRCERMNAFFSFTVCGTLSP